jgi:hypothetical protein
LGPNVSQNQCFDVIGQGSVFQNRASLGLVQQVLIDSDGHGLAHASPRLRTMNVMLLACTVNTFGGFHHDPDFCV